MRLSKGIEESTKEKEELFEEKENMMSFFKEIEKKAFVVHEDYKKTQEVFVLLHCILDCFMIQLTFL
jgi:structural maintenance of chromosome 4